MEPHLAYCNIRVSKNNRVNRRGNDLPILTDKRCVLLMKGMGVRPAGTPRDGRPWGATETVSEGLPVTKPLPLLAPPAAGADSRGVPICSAPVTAVSARQSSPETPRPGARTPWACEEPAHGNSSPRAVSQTVTCPV